MAPLKEAIFSKGLLNRPGQNNCFLNSAVQVLWHLDIFRRSFRELSGHTCMLDSCIFCALKELFSQLQFSHESALPPDALRRALAESFFDQQRFQLGFMDDAAECFENILLRIHFHLACGEAEDLCSAGHCIPHVKFAMTLVEQSVCGACGATSEPLPFTQMVHYVSASALISQAKQTPNPAHSDLFGQLLKKAGGMGDIRDCPSACGAKIQIRRTLTNHPEIVSVGIVWDSERPSLEHVMSLLGTLRTTLRLTEVFHTPTPSPNMNTPHQLVGVVTYYGKHYSTFFFHTKLRVWIYFDDANVREVGPKWEQVVDKCRRGRYQPLLLLFAAPDGTPIDPSTAPKTTTVAPTAKPPLGRRSLTPSPEKPSLATMAQRRALTPNPEQSNDANNQRPLQVLSEYQNFPAMQQKAAMWNRKELARRDSGNWSGDRNSASSSSSTSLENPYQYIIGKMQNRTNIVPRSPTSLKGGESSSGGSQCDPGYDSYSLSSTDSLPLQQTLKHNLQLAQIPEGHQSPVSLGNIQYTQTSGQSECERLCDEADMLLKHSQATEDLERALTFANAAVGKARQAMDAPYSNPQAASAARMKHNTCIMQARSIHKRLEEPNGPRHGEGRHSREGSGCSGRGPTSSHSRQNSKDKGNHSRQNSRELLPDAKPSPEIPEPNSEKNIEIYATLPKSRKGLLSRATSKVKNNTVEDEEYLMYDRPGRSLSRNKPPNGKKDEKRARSEERNSKKESQKEKEFISNQISKEAKKQIKAEEQKQGKKQHKVRRKLLMGGLIRRKNRSMPDLREDEVAIKGGSKDDTNVGKVDKQPSLSGYLSEGHLEYSGNPNLERSKLMRKSLHGSKLIQMAKVPPPPPLRTTSQLSKSDRPQFQIPDIHSVHKENTLSLWKEPEPQSLPPLGFTENKESVTYANGSYLNNCQTKLVTTAQVHQVSSPEKEYKCVVDDDGDLFDLPPYPSPLNSVTHSRQASEDFPPPPNEIEAITPSSLLEQLQRKRLQILNDGDFVDTVDSLDAMKPPTKCETWLRELQAKQAAIKNRDGIDVEPQKMVQKQTDKQPFHPQDFRGQSDAVSNEVGKHRIDDQTSSVKDLKSKFETITHKTIEKQIKPNEIPVEQKQRMNLPTSLPLHAPGVTNQIEMKHDLEIPVKNVDIEMKSSLASSRCDDIKRKTSKKKNVTFCEQVVLVATAEEDKVNSYIPNPILERVLRSVLHRDSHQETKEIAVHSVVPLKRNDSGSYGQCSVRNQQEQKEEPEDLNAIVSAEQPEKCSNGLPNEKPAESVNSNSNRPFNFQRVLPSPVPNRQAGRMQVSAQISNQSPYLSIPNHVMSPATYQNSNEPVSNSNSPYISMNSLQYHPEDQYQMSTRVNGLPIMRDSRQLSDSDVNKLSNSMQSMSFARPEYNTIPSREMEQKSSVTENPEFSNQGSSTSEQSMLYNGNNPHSIQHSPMSNMTQNSGPMSLPTSQNYALQGQYSPLPSPNYSQSSMVPPMNLIQPRTQGLAHQNQSVSQVYQQLPQSAVNAQQLLHHQQYLNSNGQLMNNPHSTLRPINSTQPLQNYQQPPVMQQRNLPSPSFHNQMLQNAPVSNGIHQINHNSNLPNGHISSASLQTYQRTGNHQLSNNSYQLKNLPANAHSEQPAYLSSISQHSPGIQGQAFSNQLPTYPSHVQLANSQLHLTNQQLSNNTLNGPAGGNQAAKAHALNHVNQQGQPISQQTNIPSPSLSIKSQLMLNHSQLSLMQNANQQLSSGVQSNQNCYMTLPQKMRQPMSNSNGLPGMNKSRPQGMYQPESPIQDFNPQHMMKNEVPNVRQDVYQRVPNLLNPDAYSNQPMYPNGPLSPTYQNPPVNPNVQLQNGSTGNQSIMNAQNPNNQSLQSKYSPYQHPPLPRQIEPQKVVQNMNGSNGRNSMCNLCRKKPIISPSIYCTDCDFYMSRFKPRT
ncbi:uncharacterized protein [Halyomorpha halys]|uniref:uncharacterized protein isoform X1 n=1 Tax=Halyomorpha halys TaxID=286706 RepID=UPI0006D4D7A4